MLTPVRIIPMSKLIYQSRTLEDSLLGKKLVDLPPPHTEPVTAKASDAERLLYTEISARLVELSKEKLDNDNPQKELSNRLAQITCLRQSVALPRVVVSVADDP